MLRGEDHESRAPQRIWPGSEDLDIVVPDFGLEDDRGAFRATDPVGLQCFDTVWPVYVREIQQFIGILSGAEEPLIQVFLDDRRAATLAMTVII